MKIAILQSDIVWNDPQKNFSLLEPHLEKAAKEKTSLLVLPEMFSTGFSLLTGNEAQEAQLASEEFLSRQSKTLGLTLAASYPHLAESQPRPSNRLALWSEGQCIASYDKTHLFRFGGEGDQYELGKRLTTVRLAGARLGLFVCYDLRFPQAFAALAMHVDLYLVVANWPAPRIQHWNTLLAARAIENQAYVIGVNRVGEGGGLSYCGSSRVVDPQGNILLDCGNEEKLALIDLDLGEVKKYRETFPVLSDRREEIYKVL